MNVSRPSFKLSGLAFQGLVTRAEAPGIDKFRIVRATTRSGKEGSSLALKPRRIKKAPYPAPRIANAHNTRASHFRRFMVAPLSFVALYLVRKVSQPAIAKTL
jgi:hypothetical protein